MGGTEVLRVLDALETAGIRAGITGGWGIDALLRRETRAHGDLTWVSQQKPSTGRSRP